MASTKHILIFVDWFEPGYRAGGPIRSIVNMVSQLTTFQFSIVTSIHDHQVEMPYEGIEPNVWVQHDDHVRVMYLTREEEQANRYRDIMTTDAYDSIYLNSMFSKSYTLTPLQVARKNGMLSKVILAPRGMLKAGALRKNRSKKAVFLFLARRFNWFKEIRWHATNQTEKEEIQKSFGKKSRVHIAPNLCRPASEQPHFLSKESGYLKLVTIARVAAEKNILGALKYLSQIEEGKVKWDIYGTLEDQAYLQKCTQWAAELPHIEATFHGEIEPALIPEKLREAHFMFLPTLGENYGHAIVESFLEGVPVIISNRTPWRKLEERHAGWDLALDKHLFKAVLSHCVSLQNEGYSALCTGAFNFGKQIAKDEAALKANRELFA